MARAVVVGEVDGVPDSERVFVVVSGCSAPWQTAKTLDEDSPGTRACCHWTHYWCLKSSRAH